MPKASRLSPGLKLRLVVEGGEWLGPGKADLLEGIAETGSISAAGKRMRMSYKRAWSLVEALNAMFREPLVAASRGGAGHGGAELTDTGRRVLALYRQMQDKGAAALASEIDEIHRLSVMSEKK
ncbi:winged helix-turn-helix domain-containing protein [Defluviimonas sp. WL0024]|uniref:Winged helix-turn-helix domain-containing protein n=2 Tax=Albidovulum TaxID=205889 RepID=A0ABT3J0P3_9RHOB|nr:MULTISPECIES: winged helix-turn-helix domain-containing protein [Defluviimonas]MCU9846997.1 winged helix-turn-helix domain-containing protein [Defluviimonas sp. WL0024]MCW3781256.1 winged helix-turn-helix domain-containing protein [Defluviimonas salinarum]